MTDKTIIQIKANDEDLKGVYANMIQITHTQEELVLDFLLAFPPRGSLVSRVVMSPGHTKRMLKALQENIEKYEKKFGEIPEVEPVMDEAIKFPEFNKE